MHRTTMRLPDGLVEDVHKCGGNVTAISKTALNRYVLMMSLIEENQNCKDTEQIKKGDNL